MKTAVGLLLLLGVAYVAVYKLGGYGSFDPTDQGRKVKAALAPGMTFNQAFDLAGDPRKYRIVNKKVQRINGVDVEELVPSPEVEVDRARIAARVTDNSLPNGFICNYYFSHQVAFALTFDGAGILTQISDSATLSDLLQTRQ